MWYVVGSVRSHRIASHRILPVEEEHPIEASPRKSCRFWSRSKVTANFQIPTPNLCIRGLVDSSRTHRASLKYRCTDIIRRRTFLRSRRKHRSLDELGRKGRGAAPAPGGPWCRAPGSRQRSGPSGARRFIFVRPTPRLKTRFAPAQQISGSRLLEARLTILLTY